MIGALVGRLYGGANSAAALAWRILDRDVLGLLRQHPVVNGVLRFAGAGHLPFRRAAQRIDSVNRRLLALRNHADKRTVAHHLHDTGGLFDFGGIERNKLRVIGGRTQNAPVQHSLGAQILHENRRARNLGGNVYARNRFAGVAALRRRQQRRIGGRHDLKLGAGNKIPVSSAGAAGGCEFAVGEFQFAGLGAELLFREAGQDAPCIRRNRADRRTAIGHGEGARRDAFVGHEPCIAGSDLQARHIDSQFIRA